jgi:hypothetical protein
LGEETGILLQVAFSNEFDLALVALHRQFATEKSAPEWMESLKYP